jgi:hypothetical protein
MIQPKPVLMLLLSHLAGCASGCVGWASSTLPPRLSAIEETKWKSARLPYSVGVEQYKYPAYSDALVHALRETGLFVRVESLEGFSTPPDLVARVEGQIHGSSAIPIGPLLPFGVIPQTMQETHGYDFSLVAPARPDEPVRVEYSYEGTTTLGWVALFEGVSPDITVMPFYPERHPRFSGRLALAILERADVLATLASGAHH